MPTVEREGLREALARTLAIQDGWQNPDALWTDNIGLISRGCEGNPVYQDYLEEADALIAGPLAPILAQADTAAQAVADRDALAQAAGFKPGPLGQGLGRKVVLEDIAGMRPAMVKARRAASEARDDADLWTMRMLEEWPGDTLLLRLWRQRREATMAAKAAQAEAARLSAAMEALRKDVIDILALSHRRAFCARKESMDVLLAQIETAANEALARTALAAGQDKTESFPTSVPSTDAPAAAQEGQTP